MFITIDIKTIAIILLLIAIVLTFFYFFLQKKISNNKISEKPLKKVKRANRIKIKNDKNDTPPTIHDVVPSAPPREILKTESEVNDDPPPQQLYYCTEDSKPVLEIAMLENESFTNYKKKRIDKNSIKINGIGQFLQSVPSVITHAKVSSGNYMEVLIHGNLTPSKQVEGWLTPMVHGPDGKFLEQAKLRDGKVLSRISGGAAIWAVASTICAQKYLADINDKLEMINKGITDVMDFLTAERKSVISGSLAYLRSQAYPAAMSGEFSSSVRFQLESIEIKMLEIQHHILDELQQLSKTTRNIENTDYFGTEELYINLKKHQEEINSRLQQFILCLRTRAASWQILSTFPGDEILKDSRKQIILQSVRNDLNPILITAEQHMFERIGELQSIWNSDETIKSRKSDLRSALDDQQQNAKMNLREISKDINALAERLSLFQNPVRLAIRMNGEDIVDAYELS